MTRNIGTIDRLVRLTLATLLLAYAYWQGSWVALGFSLFTFLKAGQGGVSSTNS